MSDEFGLRWGAPPVRGSGRNPGLTKMVDGLVKELMQRPGEWATVRFAVDKGHQAARPFIRRGCITRVLPTEGDPEHFDVYAMWPYVAHPDGLERFVET